MELFVEIVNVKLQTVFSQKKLFDILQGSE